MSNDLTGKFFLHDSGPTYRTGEFIGTAGIEHVVVKFDNIKEPKDKVFLMSVVSYKDLAKILDEEFIIPHWTIFSSRSDLEKHVSRMMSDDEFDEPMDGVIVPIKKH